MPRVQGTQSVLIQEMEMKIRKERKKNKKKHDLDNRLTAAIQNSNLDVFPY